jgi:uncharacterized protein with NRDE domain
VCTLALAFRTDRRWPLVVAANRDERLGRAAEGWALRDGGGGPRYAAPRDLAAGGTWIGVSARGLFAAVTNYHAPYDWYPDPSRRSRGELVALALAHPAAEAARAALGALAAERWNPFHLVVADAATAFRWRYDGSAAALDDLGPGLHVVTERSPDGRCPRGDLVRARWPLDLSPARLRELLSVHGPDADPLAATCIHGEPVYGTRSSTVVRLAHDLGASELLAADGHPCNAPLEDRSDLLAALARSA